MDNHYTRYGNPVVHHIFYPATANIIKRPARGLLIKIVAFQVFNSLQNDILVNWSMITFLTYPAIPHDAP